MLKFAKFIWLVYYFIYFDLSWNYLIILHNFK